MSFRLDDWYQNTSDIALDGNPAPRLRKKRDAQPPIFRPMSVVAKRLDHGWIKMSVGTEVGLGPGDIVLDGDPVPPFSGRTQFWGREYISTTV